MQKNAQQSEYRRRLRQVRGQLRELNVQGLIVIGVENVRYLTGFTGHDSWALVLPRQAVLLTDSRYTEQARSECVGCRIVERKGPLANEAETVIARQKGIAAVAIEDRCSVAMLKGIRKCLSTNIRPVGGVVERVRAVKTESEIRLIRRAAKIAFDAMEQTLKQLRAGMTERQLAALYEYKLSEYNARPAFDTIVAFGPNGSRNHHQPGTRKLKNVDTILLDFGAAYKGYCSDITRCFAVGSVSPFFQKVYETVARSQRAAIETMSAGVKGCDADTAARELIQRAELPAYGHGLGHGLGLAVHEGPHLSNRDKSTLGAGHVVTVEPGVYVPGKLGIRLEDDVLVTANGVRVLSRDRRFEVRPERVPLLKV